MSDPAAPAFDPSGSQDAVRWSLERLVSRGLVEEGATGNVVPAAAERITASHDSLVYTFHLRRGLRYTNGAPCRSADFAAALEDGLRRADHGTAAGMACNHPGKGEVVPAALGSDTFSTFASGNTPAEAAVLARLDPGALANGFYRFRLSAADVANPARQPGT